MRPVPLFLLLAGWLDLVAAARKGGGGGGDGEDSGGGGGGNGGESSSSGYRCSDLGPEAQLFESDKCGLGTCGCHMLPERQMIYGLPGLYYNGTLTVEHKIKDNAGWESGDCNRTQGDDALQTNSYPALLFVGPSGNASDTNPIHWSLYGFQPGEETKNTNGPYVDLYQRWFLVRSSDFVPMGDWCLFGGPGMYPLYGNADLGKIGNTSVYWETTVTETGGNTFSADAKFVKRSPSKADWFRMPSTYKSPDLDIGVEWENTFYGNYFTLPKVCTLDRAYTGANSTPTVWFQEGATAKMSDIGSDAISLSINNTLERAFTLQSSQEANCEGVPVGFEEGVFLNSNLPGGEVGNGRDWGLSLSVGLSFRGSLVQENSTQINETRDGRPIFAKTYMTTNLTETSTASQLGLYYGLEFGFLVSWWLLQFLG